MPDCVNLTEQQKDYSLFLPALSTFYSSYVGKQRFDDYVEKSRIPAEFEHGIEGLNYLNPKQAYFPYKWSLYSAGHANLELGSDPKEDMIRTRSADSFVLGDSGGFQIGKGVWEGDWRAGSGCPKAQDKREKVLRWMDAYMNYGMGLDIPSWVGRTPRGREATQITNYAESLAATCANFEYWMNNRNGNCKFLTVLQGEDHTEAEHWYQNVKEFCDPKIYPDRHFNGWAMGSQNKCDVHLVLKRLVSLIYDGLLEPGKQDWIHYLGTSKLEWAMLFTDIQRAIRKYHNPNLTISFDCASPFLATANGQVYYDNRLDHKSKWSYRMKKCIDSKHYASDTRMFRDALMADHPKSWPKFLDSPIMQRTQMKDICYYAPGQLNKIGKEGRTSWDSFSYAILMGHNIYAHILAVQEGNRLCDAGLMPKMLVRDIKCEDVYFRQLTEAIFSARSKDAALKLIDGEGLSKWYMDIIGSSANGYLGKKALNTRTVGNRFFRVKEVVELPDIEAPHRDDSGLGEDALDQLEAGE